MLSSWTETEKLVRQRGGRGGSIGREVDMEECNWTRAASRESPINPTIAPHIIISPTHATAPRS